MKNLRCVGTRESEFVIFTDGEVEFSGIIDLKEGIHAYSVLPYMLSAPTEKELMEKCFVNPKLTLDEDDELFYDIEKLTKLPKADIIINKDPE